MAQFKPQKKNQVNLSARGDVRLKGDLTELSESVIDITENSDSYDVELEDPLTNESITRNIPKDWVESVDLSNNSISYYPPSNHYSEYDIEIKSKEVTDKFGSGIAKNIKINFVVKPNDLTHILNDDRLSDFRSNFYYKEREITEAEFDDLKKEIEEIPVKQIEKGDLSDTKTRPITPPSSGGRDWIDQGESNKITFTATLIQETDSYAEARFKTGNHSVTWSVSSQTDWMDKKSSSTSIDVYEDPGSIVIGEVIESFERSNPLQDYTGDTGNIELETSIVTHGSRSMKITENDGNIHTVTRTLQNSKSPSYIRMGIRCDSGSVTYSKVKYFLYDSNGNTPIRLWNEPYSDKLLINNKEINPSDSTWYVIEFSGIDWSNGQISEVYVNGNLEFSDIDFMDTTSSFSELFAEVNSQSRGTVGYIDETVTRDSSGTWNSNTWDAGTSTQQKLDSFETNVDYTPPLTSLSFDSSNDYVSIPSGSSHTFGDEDFSLAAWVKTTSNGAILSQGEGGLGGSTGTRYTFEIRSGNAFFEIDDGSTLSSVSSTNSVSDGNWHFLVAERDTSSDELKIYVDGSLSNTNSDGTGSISSADGDLFMGVAAWDDNYFGGQIDDARVYDHVLSSSEIDTLYDNREKELGDETGWYPINEMSGSTLYDDSGNNNDGTIYGATWVEEGGNENVEVRLSVDEDDDGEIEKTSSWVSLSDGTNNLSASDFDISTEGYRYQLEYQLSVTDSDTSHSPSVQDYSLTTSDATVTKTDSGSIIHISSNIKDAASVAGVTDSGSIIHMEMSWRTAAVGNFKRDSGSVIHISSNINPVESGLEEGVSTVNASKVTINSSVHDVQEQGLGTVLDPGKITINSSFKQVPPTKEIGVWNDPGSIIHGDVSIKPISGDPGEPGGSAVETLPTKFGVTKSLGVNAQDAEFGEDLIDVEITDAVNRFAREATLRFKDPGQSKEDEYDDYTKVDIYIRDDGETFRRFSGYAIEQNYNSKDKITEIKVISYDNLLRGRDVYASYSNREMSEVIALLMFNFTDLNLGDLEVTNDQLVTRSFNGVKLDSVLQEFSQRSDNEVFGVDNDMNFFFRPRDPEDSPIDFAQGRYFSTDWSEDAKREINRATVNYSVSGSQRSVIAEDVENQKTISEKIDAFDDRVVIEESANIQGISSRKEAKEKAESMLNEKRKILTGTIQTWGCYRVRPGMILQVDDPESAVSGEFRVAEISYSMSDGLTEVKVAENKPGVIDLLQNMSDGIKRGTYAGLEGEKTEAVKLVTTEENLGMDGGRA